jgi:hypothetical protein
LCRKNGRILYDASSSCRISFLGCIGASPGGRAQTLGLCPRKKHEFHASVHLICCRPSLCWRIRNSSYIAVRKPFRCPLAHFSKEPSGPCRPPFRTPCIHLWRLCCRNSNSVQLHCQIISALTFESFNLSSFSHSKHRLCRVWGMRHRGPELQRREFLTEPSHA